MTWRIIKVISNDNYLGLSNRNAESVHISVFSVDDNPEPGGNLKSVRSNTRWRLLGSNTVLWYSRDTAGHTRWQIKVEVGLGYCSAKDKCLNLHEKWYLKENMVGTTIAKNQFTDTRWFYIKEIVIITRNFHDRIYIVSMGMNTKFKVDSHFFNV